MFAFLDTIWEKMLLNRWMAWYWASPGAAKGNVGWCPWSDLARESAVRVASSSGDANGTAQLWRKKLTVPAVRSDLVLGV